MASPGPAPAALRWPPARGGCAGHPKEKRERGKRGEREVRETKGEREKGAGRPLVAGQAATGGGLDRRRPNREEGERKEWGAAAPPKHGLARVWPRPGARSGAQGGAGRHRRRGWRTATPRRGEGEVVAGSGVGRERK